MAENEPQKPGWSMGLGGWTAQIANLTAVGLICLMFYQDRQESMKSTREDRALFRETIQKLSDASSEQWRAIRNLATQIKVLTEEVRKPKEEEEQGP